MRPTRDQSWALSARAHQVWQRAHYSERWRAQFWMTGSLYTITGGLAGRVGASHSSTLRSRKAFVMTDTELKVIAALAIIGLRSTPKNGYSTPAAIGTPSTL